jgi:hypothetical protein
VREGATRKCVGFIVASSVRNGWYKLPASEVGYRASSTTAAITIFVSQCESEDVMCEVEAY